MGRKINNRIKWMESQICSLWERKKEFSNLLKKQSRLICLILILMNNDLIFKELQFLNKFSLEQTLGSNRPNTFNFNNGNVNSSLNNSALNQWFSCIITIIFFCFSFHIVIIINFIYINKIYKLKKNWKQNSNTFCQKFLFFFYFQVRSKSLFFVSSRVGSSHSSTFP